MSWPTPRFIALGSIAFVALVTLVTFQATSRAEAGRASPLSSGGIAGEVRRGPVWVPEIVTAPGLPLQCSDGTWTRTVVRGGCARHGGVSY
jgi:hypothetical protein